MAQFVLLGGATSSTLLVAAAVAGGLGHGLVFPTLIALVVDRAAMEERGTALAVFSGLFDVVVLVGAPLAGAMIEASGYGRAFQAVAGTVALGLIGFVLWERWLRTERIEP